MNSFRAGVLSLGAILIGIVTLRTIRQRRVTPKEEAEIAVDDAKTEAAQAMEHATAAAGHARRAGGKAVEHVREEQLGPEAVAVEARTEDGRKRARIPKAGKGWIRQ